MSDSNNKRPIRESDLRREYEPDFNAPVNVHSNFTKKSYSNNFNRDDF